MPLFIQKNAPVNYEEDFKQISQGSISRSNNFLLGFAGISLKLEKFSPKISTFNLFPSLPSVTRDERKQFQCLIIVSITKLNHYYINSIDARNVLAF